MYIYIYTSNICIFFIYIEHIYIYIYICIHLKIYPDPFPSREEIRDLRIDKLGPLLQERVRHTSLDSSMAGGSNPWK